MKIKNLKIGTQLMLGFAAMLVFVVMLGVVSYQQSDKISLQGETMYSHPLKVRSAIGALEADILKMRLATRDLMLAKTEQEKQDAIQIMELAAADVHLQFGILKTQYLGPTTDVDEAYNAYISWKTAREENTKLAHSGEIEKVKASILSTGSVGVYREKMMVKVMIIDDFARNKAEELYTSSQELNSQLNRQLIWLVVSILLLSGLIIFILLRNIRKPLGEITEATQRFHNGDQSARSAYESGNEFGTLSASFNSLAERIEMNMDLKEKAAKLAAIMLSEDDARRFFKLTLHALSSHTGSQMAAVYLLDSNKKTFEHFESIGMDEQAKRTFAANGPEGEFGAVLIGKKIVHLTQIPDDTRFTFQVVAGKFRPREIITIPILEFDEVVAIISLASLNDFSLLSRQLITEIWATLTARINGVRAFNKILDFSAKLDMQNKELEHQSKEMAMQADELKEYNIELELQKKELHEANQLKSAFLSNMSHELRTPLNSVIALSGVLNRKLKNQISEDEYSYLGIIEKNGKQLLSLINDILDLSRIEAGKEEISYSEFSLSSLVNGIIESLEPIAGQKGIGLINHVQANIPTIISDSAKCHHILQNIISNAVKFTENGSVEVSAEVKDGKFHIGVKDTGIGISNEHLPFIFDEFRQADGKSSRKFGGTGLGLAIAKKYTQLLEGTIEVRSQVGAGSVFVIMFPEKPAASHQAMGFEADNLDHNPAASGTFSTAKYPGLGKTLLVVEDSEPQIIQLTDILKEEGYNLQVARNGQEALYAIQVSIPDAMILDLMMPEVDGFEVLKAIRNQNETSRIPVLILSAKHVSKEELSFLKSNNVHQLIQKGDVNRTDLLKHVYNMVSAPEKAITKSEKEKSSARSLHGKASILLIEDNDDNTTTVKALLGEKYELIYATDGLKGLEKAQTLNPGLILLDISLPEMDGFSVLKEIKKNEQLLNIPVIALTARAMKGDREDLLSHGFDDYISKPIDNTIFEETINKWLNGNKMNGNPK